MAASLAKQIEDELKSLNRWSDHPLPEEKFENMGAFGCNTMAFEQWIQFVLLDRLRNIVANKGEFPKSSSVAAYAVSTFDGDYETVHLQELLSRLDALIDGEEFLEVETQNQVGETITLNSTEIPPVLFTVIDLLPQFKGDDLESQLQTIDSLVSVLNKSVRHTISTAIQNSINEKTVEPEVRARILKAAEAIARGENAAAPYNHDEYMKKYREEHLKSFPGFSYDDEKKE